MTYVLFDIGGSKLRVAVSHDGERLDAVESFKTPRDPKKALRELTERMKRLAPKGDYKVAGGVRGVLNEDHTGIERDGVLTQWVDVPIADEIAHLLGTHSVLLENDTAIAGLGEAYFGAGKGVDIVVYHTISTGVGGARIESGVIDRASVGFEPGHQILDIDRTILGEDVSPTLENLVSGTALEKRMNVKPHDIDQSDVVWHELAGYLGQGLRNSILYWSPEIIILGGSMMIGDPRIPIESVRKATVDALDNIVPCPFITTAALGDEAGLYGALALLRQAE